MSTPDSALASAVRALFVEVFALDPQNLPQVLDIDTIEAWDSLGHLRLVDAINRRFDLSLAYTATLSMGDEQAVIAMVADKCARAGTPE